MLLEGNRSNVVKEIPLEMIMVVDHKGPKLTMEVIAATGGLTVWSFVCKKEKEKHVSSHSLDYAQLQPKYRAHSIHAGCGRYLQLVGEIGVGCYRTDRVLQRLARQGDVVVAEM